jgi:hypothetical protein
MEFLAAGRPVVSVRIPQVELAAGELVRIADSPDEFCRAIQSELERDCDELRSRRQALAARNDWDAKAAEIEMRIDELLGDGR